MINRYREGLPRAGKFNLIEERQRALDRILNTAKVKVNHKPLPRPTMAHGSEDIDDIFERSNVIEENVSSLRNALMVEEARIYREEGLISGIDYRWVTSHEPGVYDKFYMRRVPIKKGED